MNQHTVFIAEPYDPMSTGSFGKASGMFICQHDFPHAYGSIDKIEGSYLDRIEDSRGLRLVQNIVKKHVGHGVASIESWARTRSKEDVMAFCIDVLGVGNKAAFDDGTMGPWTGCRILLSINVGNGHKIFTIELFAKHPDSETEVHSGARAPNVKRCGLTISSLHRGMSGMGLHEDGRER